jgi:hypothetical protein
MRIGMLCALCARITNWAASLRGMAMRDRFVVPAFLLHWQRLPITFPIEKSRAFRPPDLASTTEYFNKG